MPSNPKTRNQWQSPILQGVPYVQQTWGPYIAVRSRLYKTIDTTFVGYTLGHYSWHFHMTSHESSVHIWNISLPSNTFFIFFNWYLKKKLSTKEFGRIKKKKNCFSRWVWIFCLCTHPFFFFQGCLISPGPAQQRHFIVCCLFLSPLHPVFSLSCIDIQGKHVRKETTTNISFLFAARPQNVWEKALATIVVFLFPYQSCTTYTCRDSWLGRTSSLTLWKRKKKNTLGHGGGYWNGGERNKKWVELFKIALQCRTLKLFLLLFGCHSIEI